MICDKVLLLSLLAAAAANEAAADGTTDSTSTATDPDSTSTAADSTSTADKLLPGETKCTCALPGGSGKCNKGSGTSRWEVCSWLQECHTSSNSSFSMCISKGNKVCNRHVHLGESGSIVAAKEHKPYMICCDEQACTSRQECIEQEGGNGTFEYEYANSDGSTTTMMKWTLADVAHNGWKTKEGTAFLNKPKVCIDRVFDATQAAKSLLAPFLAMVIAVLFILLGCCNRNVSCCGMVLPLIIIGMSFFLSLSEGVYFALFTMGVAAATIATPSQHKGKLVLFQVFYAWLLVGGTNWFFQVGTITNYMGVVSSKTIIEVETSCKAYFHDYYALADAQKTFKTDETYTTWGLCERGWLQFLTLVAYAQAFAFFLMVALTTLEYLSPTKGGKGKKFFKREKLPVSVAA